MMVTQTIDSKEIAPNPFDWTREVTKSELFAGRQEELTLITNELTCFAQQSDAIPIAVVGVRRIGKSSLLRRATDICKDLNIAHIRIDLSLITASSCYHFWRQVMESLVQFCHEQGFLENGVGL